MQRPRGSGSGPVFKEGRQECCEAEVPGAPGAGLGQVGRALWCLHPVLSTRGAREGFNDVGEARHSITSPPRLPPLFPCLHRSVLCGADGGGRSAGKEVSEEAVSAVGTADGHWDGLRASADGPGPWLTAPALHRVPAHHWVTPLRPVGPRLFQRGRQHPIRASLSLVTWRVCVRQGLPQSARDTAPPVRWSPLHTIGHLSLFNCQKILPESPSLR